MLTTLEMTSVKSVSYDSPSFDSPNYDSPDYDSPSDKDKKVLHPGDAIMTRDEGMLCYDSGII